MKRTTISLLAASAALAAITGFATLTAPGKDGSPAPSAAPARLPVERSSLLCPAPGASEAAETAYTSFTPAGGTAAPKSEGDGTGGATAELRPSVSTLADGDDTAKAGKKGEPEGKETPEGEGTKEQGKPVLSLKEPGKPAAAEASGADAPALLGTATGRFAPGWTAQQTTKVTAGAGRGLLGVSCTAPDTDFWLPGASTGEERRDYVHLTNPDETAAVVDIELYGEEGLLKSTLSEGIPVPAGTSVPVLLSTLTAERAVDVTVHVTTRSGRVGAVVRAADENTGSDWLSASADPSATAVLPGIPKDAVSVRLVAFAPGESDAELRIQLAGPDGLITPAGNESLHVKSGMTASIDLQNVTRGEAGSLVVSPAEGRPATPVVAALRVVRGKGDKQEIAFIPATAPVGERAAVADNRAKGSTLSLTAPGAAAKVRVTASAGTEGGSETVKTYDVKGGTTLSVTPPVPSGLKGTYALTLETESGGPVHAARMLELPEDGIPMFTVQTLPYDEGTVAVPEAKQDLSVLDD
ncbi:DUF5719 family protein [Streptomyces sp. MUM 178J]|uniref:DUF5719 family protein n=1 Tax=Streptomyces sp. MUM 178J TaxID=2791991 RepID=UPI001F04F838|nr:DUF5719 family protein [Streptomyces sp. MUM 178J]WRQ79704.1 DUF5719 family protein [Streptomyces sp. MUM 178J]